MAYYVSLSLLFIFILLRYLPLDKALVHNAPIDKIL